MVFFFKKRGWKPLHNLIYLAIMPPKHAADQNGQSSNKKQRTEEQNINEKESRLIQMVKENPILYDLGDANHKNSEMKKVVWDQIAAELQEDGESIENI